MMESIIKSTIKPLLVNSQVLTKKQYSVTTELTLDLD